MTDLLRDFASSREKVVAEALSWVGTPYHHQARKKGVGVDCAMLLLEVYHNAGFIPDITFESYPPDWHHHKNEERYLKWVKRYAFEFPGPPLPGDVAMYRFGKCTAHGAIVVHWPTVIHAFLPAGCVVPEDALSIPDLVDRFTGFYRLKEWA